MPIESHLNDALPFAALAAVPARVHVEIGDTEAHLLLPLYGVVAAAALALFWELPGEERRPRELGAVALPLALWIGWSGVSILWTRDLREAGIELVFFVLPFGLLAVCLARLPWSRRGATWLLATFSNRRRQPAGMPCPSDSAQQKAQ